MWPNAMKTICFLQPIDEFIQSLKSLLTANEFPFDTDKDGHYTETGSTRSNNMFVVVRINVVNMKAFACSTRGWFCSIPEILKCSVFYQCEKGVIADGCIYCYTCFRCRCNT